jgi:hypothetical protein
VLTYKNRACLFAGDFNDLEPPLGDYPDIYGDNSGAGYTITVPHNIVALLLCAWLLVHAR